MHTPSGSDSTLPNRCEVWGEGGRGDERHMGEKGTDKEQEKECLKVKMPERT